MRLERLARLAATALCFALFGLGCLLIRCFAVPVLVVAVRQRSQRSRRVRALIRFMFRGFVGVLCGLRVMTLEIRGAERLERRGLLILANHPTLIDVVILMSLVREADCVVKAGLRAHPFMRGPLLAAGFVCNDSGPGVVQDCIDAVRNGSNMIIFPEGSRTVPGEPLVLQRGAANVAVRGNIDVTPVVIECSAVFLPKGRPWYRIPAERPHIRLTVQDDIAVAPFTGIEPALGARRLTHFLQDHFTRELAHDAGTRNRTQAAHHRGA